MATPVKSIRSPREILSLNGAWQLQPGNDDSIPSKWEHSVPVPALVDLALPGYEWNKHRHDWYKTVFDLREISDSAFIVIGQAMFGTEVWLNGRHLGGDIACYTSQEYDARAAIRAGSNELIVRTGRREDLPPHSAAGSDQERSEWIPGIWGDVSVVQSGNPRVQRIQVIPHIDPARAEIRVTLQNLSNAKQTVRVTSRVIEKSSREPAGAASEAQVTIEGNGSLVVPLEHAIEGARLWSPESPFLYETETAVWNGSDPVDLVSTAFGLREFKIRGSDFTLNGNRIFLRGGNIAFHRFLSDPERGVLPWDRGWIRKALIDIPKSHNFNFFRNHIGQMYNRWYDIADEYGMLLQNEWMFWTTSGSKEQIRIEFTKWLQDNWNHPSIVIWDALNECTDPMIQHEIVPEMKKLDPTRPWESVDFVEQHPYIYSLCPVLNDRRMGFTDSLDSIEHSPAPSVVNEFLGWWIDRRGEPTILTAEVIERWRGNDWSPAELEERQSFLALELVGLFRRMRVDAIQPFVYLSNDTGPTANWFTGAIRDLTPKPVLRALKNAFAPFGLSLELWDRHFFTNEHRRVRLFVFNDNAEDESGSVRYGVTDRDGEWLSEERFGVAVDAGGCAVMPLTFIMPGTAGEYRMRAELTAVGESFPACVSQKVGHVFETIEGSAHRSGKSVSIVGCEEVGRFLKGHVYSVTAATEAGPPYGRVILASEPACPEYQALITHLSAHVRNGGTLVLIEPEFRITGGSEVRILEDL